MSSARDADRVQKLKSALWLACGKVADSTCSELGGVTASTNFIAALTDYVWEQSQSLAADAEAFAKHRDSTVIETKDILLCTRRNEALQALIKEDIENYVKEQSKK